MNINPRTGKPWINNYMQMMGTLLANQNHEYVQLYRYFDVIGRLEGRTKAGYAMLLHSHLAQVICNRSPGIHSNIFMYIDNGKGHLSNSNDMKEFMEMRGWMNCNAGHLLKIASHEVWWLVYKMLLELGMITVSKGTLRVMFPVEGRFLPIPYAHVALLSRIKKDSNTSKAVLEAMAQLPSQMRTNLEELPKEDLINEFIKLKTQNLTPTKSNPVYQLLMEEIKVNNPHQFGKNVEKKRENFLKEITEEILEKKLENKVQNKVQKKVENNLQNKTEINLENIPGNNPETIVKNISKLKPVQKKSNNIHELKVEDIHNFERTDKKSRNKSKKVIPNDTDNCDSDLEYAAEDQSVDYKTDFKITLENAVFYAEDTTAKDLKKIQDNIPETKPENEIEKFAPSDMDIDEELSTLPDSAYDMFGLELEFDDDNVPLMPDVIETIKESVKPDTGFWD